MATFTALYDACVLYPAPLRDLLLELAVTDLFRAKWSSDIHDEWIRAVLDHRSDLTVAQLRRTRDLMDEHALDCLVEDFEELIPSLTLHRARLKHPPKTTTEYLETLERQSLTQFVAALRPYAARL